MTRMSAQNSPELISGCRLIEDSGREEILDRLYGCLRSKHRRFPGSQPKSFSSKSLLQIEAEDYWVCEKTDGLRVILFIWASTKSPDTRQMWLMDRKQRLYSLDSWDCSPCVPVRLNHLQGTILDGELLWSSNSSTGKLDPAYHAFDCLALEGDDLANMTFAERYEKLGECVVDSLWKDCVCGRHGTSDRPLSLSLKRQEKSYHVDKVLSRIQSGSRHQSDGLIFSAVNRPLYRGPERVIKWKPPESISIDLLARRSAPSKSGSSKSISSLCLYSWSGGDDYDYFDEVVLDGRSPHIGVKDVIVEVTRDMKKRAWTINRVRDDKRHPNHRDIVRDILRSIKDGVDVEQLLQKKTSWRIAWETRAASTGSRP